MPSKAWRAHAVAAIRHEVSNLVAAAASGGARTFPNHVAPGLLYPLSWPMREFKEWEPGLFMERSLDYLQANAFLAHELGQLWEPHL